MPSPRRTESRSLERTSSSSPLRRLDDETCTTDLPEVASATEEASTTDSEDLLPLPLEFLLEPVEDESSSRESAAE